MKTVKKLIAIVALLLLPAWAAFAVSATVSGALYEVEVLVFKNLLPDLEGNEMWVVPALADISSGEGEFDTEIQHEDAGEAVYVAGRLPKEDSQLSVAAEALGAHDDYEILLHKKWVQNAEARSTSKLLQIVSDPQLEPQLDGSIRFYVSRFFHLYVDVALNESGGVFPASAEDSEMAIQSYKIVEDRRIKTEDIHYFDHPKFGILVQVSPVKAGRK